MIQLGPALLSQFAYYSAIGLYEGLENSAEKAAMRVNSSLLKLPPDLLGAADAIVGFITGLPGVLLTSYYYGVEKAVQDIVKAAKFHNRLIRFDDAVSLVFESVRNGIRELTFTSEDGVIFYVASNIAHFVWRFVKNVVFIKRLVGAETIEQLVEIIFNKIKKRAMFVKFAVFWIGAITVFAFIGFQIVLIGLLSSLITGTAISKVLAQDSKKRRFKVRSVRRRVNVRAGPDE